MKDSHKKFFGIEDRKPLQFENLESAMTGVRNGGRVSIFVFVLMLFGAIWYFAERMLFCDAAYIAFHAINEKTLQIQQFRFGAFITQMVPVIGAKMGVPLKYILLAYSASFHVFYLLVALILYKVRAYRLLILFAFYWLLIATETFFWPNNEVHQGIAYMMLMFAGLELSRHKQWPLIIPIFIVLVAGSTAIFCHPLVIPAIVSLWIFFLIERKPEYFRGRDAVILSGVLLLIVGLKIYVSRNFASYDSARLEGVQNIHLSDLITVFKKPLAKQIYSHALSNYWILGLLAIWGIAYLIFHRRLLAAAWILACCYVYFLFVNMTFYEYVDFIFESELMPLILIGAGPFVYSVLPRMRSLHITILMLLIITARLITFAPAVHTFSQRKERLEAKVNAMREQDITKLILVKKPNENLCGWMFDWGMPCESVILSSLAGDNPVRIFAAVNEGDMGWAMPAGTSDILISFQIWPAANFDRNYFPVDTTGTYETKDFADFMCR